MTKKKNTPKKKKVEETRPPKTEPTTTTRSVPDERFGKQLDLQEEADKMDKLTELERKKGDLPPGEKRNVLNERKKVDSEKPRFQVQFDLSYDGAPGIEPKGESQTEPDMNLTVRQLLVNYSRGYNSEHLEKTPLYLDIKIPQIKDITDVQVYKQKLIEQVESINQFLEEEAREKEAAEKLKNNPPPPPASQDDSNA